MSAVTPRDRVSQRWSAVLVVVLGVVLLAVSVAAMLPGDGPAPPAGQVSTGPSTLDRRIAAAQAELSRQPQDPATWAELGAAYVEQARITADPSYYTKAEGALRNSLDQQPTGNGAALIGMGALANARHDFTAARDWGEQAKALLPDTAEVYGVLTDAHTQLGDAAAATESAQRMLDLKPGVAAFTRAAYDFELHGRTDDARYALERAVRDSVDPSDVAFCRYRLGELAFDTGDLAEAERQYEAGLRVVPQDVPLNQGRAKIAAARGHTDAALAGYQDIVTRMPSPQYLHEYAVLLRSVGKTELAAEQFDLIARQEQLQRAAGAGDDLAASLVAADRGDAGQALARAEAEWSRRQPVLVADALAWALHLNGRDAEALQYADRAASLGWRNASFLFHRGMILAALGRDTEAIEALDDALGVNPYFSPPHVSTARQTIDALRGNQ